MLSKTRMFLTISAIVCGIGLPFAAHATPIISNVLGADSVTVNPSTFAEGLTTISSSGLTISGGTNYTSQVGVNYTSYYFPGMDLSFQDTSGPIEINFSNLTSSFGFDFITAADVFTVSAYSATDALLEEDTFSLTGLSTDLGEPSGYAGMTGVDGIDHVIITTDYGPAGVIIGSVTYKVPEPMTITLIGTSLLGFGVLRRRKFRSRH
ncbi:PEP-CTERM sorting domain-containing protein [Telmatospirillum sp.]|uniref:PEP-CTERM sorting domain-containing protein n=1 Tax=Telmatospirillum sp. TaxID=2079197 RepID=UPI00283E4FF9|nr:PEP-CTERM sorting domain-containing protein [Telmatospirillum sp.]MDR3436371.1 PEP-CTERM sorting domain-containing protein [Telmatospirillum sp.]